MVVRLALVVAASFAISCVRDNAGLIAITQTQVSQDVNLGFTSSTVLADGTAVRAIVLGAEGSVLAGEFCNNQVMSHENLFFTTRSGYRDIFFFTHEPVGSTDLSGDEENDGYLQYVDIEQAQIEFNPDLYDPTIVGFSEDNFPSVAMSLNTLLLPGEVNYIENLEMQRRSAKVEVNLTYTKVPAKYSETDFEIISLQVVDLPHWCYWLDNICYPVAEDEVLAMTNIQDVENEATGLLIDTDDIADHISSNTFYVPSYYVTDNNTAKIAIGLKRIRKDGTPLADGVQEYMVKYFPLGDALNTTQTGSEVMNISPNTSYKVNLTVYAESFVVYTDIAPWDYVDLSGDIVEPNTLSAPYMVVMDFDMLCGSTSYTALFSANLEVQTYVNGQLVAEGTKLTDYIDSTIDMSWLTDSTLVYDEGSTSGYISLDYDPTNGNINESNYLVEVVFKSSYLTRTMLIVSGKYAGAIYGDILDWELEDLDELITQQRSLYLPAYTSVKPSEMASDEYTVLVPFRSTNDVTLHIGDDKSIVMGEGVDLTEEEGNGWVTRVEIFDQEPASDGTMYITFTIDKETQITDLEKIRTYFSLSILDGQMSVESYLLYYGQSYGIDPEVEGDWNHDDELDSDVYDQYDISAPYYNFIDVIELKSELINYYDITYTSTHETTALINGVAVSTEYVSFDPAVNGWLIGAQFMTPYSDSGDDTTVLRIFVDTTFGEGDNYTDEADDLTIDVTLLSHRITKYIEVRIGGVSDDLFVDTDSDWDSVPDIDGEIFDQYLLNAPYSNAISILELKQDLINYYDIAYTSTHETTAVIDGVEIGTEKVTFDSPVNGWLLAAQFVQPYETSDATFLRLWIDVDYDGSDLMVEITLNSHRITKYITATLKDLTEDMDANVDGEGEWDKEDDLDGEIFDQYSLDAPYSNAISILGLKQDLISYYDIAYTSTHETTAEISGVTISTEKVTFDSPVNGWLLAAQFVQPYETSDATFLRLWIDVDYDGDDLMVNITLNSHRITKYITATLKDLTEDLDAFVDGDGAWDKEDELDGEIFDQYLLDAPAVNAISVNTLKANGVSYYDIIYTSTLTTTALIDGVTVDREYVAFSPAVMGWLKGAQFVDDAYDNTKTVLRLWIDVDYGDGDNFTNDMDDLTYKFVMLSHNITKHITITLHDLTEDMDAEVGQDGWDKDDELDSDVMGQDDILVDTSIKLSGWVYSWIVSKPGDLVDKEEDEGNENDNFAPEFVEIDNSVDGYFYASVPYSSTADLTITMPNVSGSWINSITLTALPWDSADSAKDLGTPADSKSGWLTFKFSKSTTTNSNSESFDIVFENRFMKTTTVVSY